MALKPKPYIAGYQEQYLKDSAKVYPCHANRASECGHPCARYLTYCRTNWKDRKPFGTTTYAIFELGKELERVVVQGWLQDRLGLEVVSPKHAAFSYPEVQLTGHLDCYIEETTDEEGTTKPLTHSSEPDPNSRSNTWVPVEVKGIARGTWQEIHKFGDLLKSKRSWVRKWAGQLLVYMLMDNKPYGRFVFFSKETGLMKDIPVILEDHLDLAEAILKKLELVNKHVADGTLPDRFYEPGTPSKLCEDCGFGHLCLPGGGYGTALSLVDDPEIEQAIDLYTENKKLAKAATGFLEDNKELCQKIRGMLEGKDNHIIGKYRITGKMRKGKNPYWMWKAEVLGK